MLLCQSTLNKKQTGLQLQSLENGDCNKMLRLIDQSEMFRTASHAPKAAVPKNSNTPEQGLSGEHKLGPGSCGAKFL